MRPALAQFPKKSWRSESANAARDVSACEPTTTIRQRE